MPLASEKNFNALSDDSNRNLKAIAHAKYRAATKSRRKGRGACVNKIRFGIWSFDGAAADFLR